MRSMFLREYFRMLFVISAAMLVYYVTINPWIEWGADRPKQLSRGFVNVDQSEQWWAKLYGDESWQSQKPERLLTKRAEILYQSVENIGPARYKLRPLTILVPQRSEGSTTPTSVIVIDNPDGAEVQFDADIRLVSGGVQSTTVSSVHLDGPVTMRSLKLVDGVATEETMEAVTSQLKIDGNRIWSPQEIELKFGNSIFLGRDFEFIASSDILGKKADTGTNEGPFAGLDHMEIYYVNRVDIELEEAGMLQDQARQRRPTGDLPAAHLQVQCKSSFHFDFSRLLASLKDRVVVQHWLPGFPTDEIEADRVDLQFAFKPKTAQAISSSDEQTQFELGDGYLALDRIEAFGKNSENPADESRWVAINAPNFLASCKTRWFNIFLHERKVELANTLPTETTIETSPVYLHREDVQVWSPKLIYKMDPAASDVAANAKQHMGMLWAQGPGEATMTSKTGEVWTANWAHELTLRPDGEEDLVIVEGAAQVRSSTQGRFTAERFEIWITSLAAKTLHGVAPKNEFVPTRLRAFKDVIVASTNLRAQVAELKLWFEHVYPTTNSSAEILAQQPTENGNLIEQPSVPQTSPAIVEKEGQPSIQNASTTIDPSTGLATPRGSESATQGKRGLFSDITTITGSTLEAKLKIIPNEDPVIDHLLLQGDVTMTKDRVSDKFALPATITGDSIVLENAGGSDLFFHIYGQPARVLVGNGNVIGNSIHFDQHRQLLFMDQPGEMTVPPEILTETVKPSQGDARMVSSNLKAPPLMNPQLAPQDPNQGRWLEAPRVAWNGEMTFDGHLAKLSKGVFIRGVWQSDAQTLWHLESNSDELYVEVSGSAFEQNSSQPSKVESVHLSGNVDIRTAQTNLQMDRHSIEHFKLPLLTVYPQQQTLRGMGPGSLLSRRFNRKTAAPGSAVPNESQEALQCVHLTYLGEMDGSYAESRVTFKQDVAAVLGPISDWSQALDVDRINMPAPGQTKLETEELSVYSTKDRPTVREMERRFPGSTKSAWELRATGNVIIDAHSERGMMNVTANQGQYDALNEILHFAGVPNRPATFRQLPSPAAPRGFQANLFEGSFNLRTGESNMSMTNISGSVPQQNAAAQSGTAAPQNSMPTEQGNAPQIKSPRDFDVFQRQR